MARREDIDNGHFGDKATTNHPLAPKSPFTCKIHSPLLRPSKVSSHYGISLMSRILISNSGPGVIEVPQMQFLRYSYWSIIPLDLNKEINYLLPHTQYKNVQ